MKNIAENLKHLRKLNNLSKEDLSKAIHISITNLDKYENSVIETPLSIIMRYSDYFKVSIDTICKDDIKNSEIIKKSTSEQNTVIEDMFDFLKNNKGMNIDELTDKEKALFIVTAKFFYKYRFEKRQYRIIMSLLRIIGENKYSKEQLEDIIEILDILDFGKNNPFERYEFYEICRDTHKLVTEEHLDLLKNNAI